MWICGRETFLTNPCSAPDSSSGVGFEFGIASSPYNANACIFGGKATAGSTGALGALVAGFAPPSAAIDGETKPTAHSRRAAVDAFKISEPRIMRERVQSNCYGSHLRTGVRSSPIGLLWLLAADRLLAPPGREGRTGDIHQGAEHDGRERNRATKLQCEPRGQARILQADFERNSSTRALIHAQRTARPITEEVTRDVMQERDHDDNQSDRKQ